MSSQEVTPYVCIYIHAHYPPLHPRTTNQGGKLKHHREEVDRTSREIRSEWSMDVHVSVTHSFNWFFFDGYQVRLSFLFFFFLNVYLGRFPCLSAGVYKRFGLTRNSVGGVTGSHAGHRDEFFFFFFFLDQGGDGRFE